MTANKYYKQVKTHSGNIYLNLINPFKACHLLLRVNEQQYGLICFKKPFFEEEKISTYFANHSVLTALQLVINKAKDTNCLFSIELLDLNTFTTTIFSRESFHLGIVDAWFTEVGDCFNSKLQKVCNFNVFFGCLNDDTSERLRHILKKVGELITARFNLFSDLLYGTIIAVENLPKRTRATYAPYLDIIRVSRKITYTKNYRSTSVRSILHELGHRALEKGYLDLKACIRTFEHNEKVLTNTWFPTKYSLTTVKEWVAEIFCEAIFNNNELYKDFLATNRTIASIY